MKSAEQCVIGIAGLGLMGGAFALALRKSGAGSGGGILALDKNPAVLKAALARGLADKTYTDAAEMFPRCDLVFLCLNPSTLVRFWKDYQRFVKSGALVTDIAGIKGAVISGVEDNLRSDVDFIHGHPMAGAEKGGFANASLVSFRGKNYIITPLKRNRAENISWFRELARRMGFTRITETTASDHDSKIAFTSQLCHVIAASLIDCEADREITRYGGGSFEDLTRIAMLNAPMWTELFIENRNELLDRIGQFEKSLDKIKSLVAAGDAQNLQDTLQAVRERRTAMIG